MNEVPHLLGSKFIVCCQTEYKNMSSTKYLRLRSVLDFAHVNASQNSRTYKLQKEEFKIWRTWPIEKGLWLIELRFYKFLNQAQQLAKHLGFEFNIARYKKKTLIHVFQALRVTLVRFVRFCNLLNLQAPIEDQIHIASTDGVKLLASLQLSSVLKIKAWTGG